MRAAEVFCSPNTREGFGIIFIEAMTADCTVIAADHPESAADEVIADAGFCVEPAVDAITEALEAALNGTRPPQPPSTAPNSTTGTSSPTKPNEPIEPRSTIRGEDTTQLSFSLAKLFSHIAAYSPP